MTPEIKLIEWFDSHWYKIKYQIEDKEVTEYLPSVTTKLNIIAKLFLAYWRGDIGNREADLRVFEAQERGVRIHHGWYTMTTGGTVIYQPWQHPNYAQSEIDALTEQNAGNLAVIRYQDEMYDLWKLKRWIETVKPKFLFSELTVYSLSNKDAGTADNVMFLEEGEYLVNGKTPLKLAAGNYIADLKTGKVVDDNAYLQTAAYAKCFEEMGLGEITGSLILHTQAKTRSAIEGLATIYRTKEQVEQDYQDYRLASALWERKNADAKPDVFEFPALLTLKGDQNGKESK